MSAVFFLLLFSVAFSPSASISYQLVIISPLRKVAIDITRRCGVWWTLWNMQSFYGRTIGKTSVGHGVIIPLGTRKSPCRWAWGLVPHAGLPGLGETPSPAGRQPTSKYFYILLLLFACFTSPLSLACSIGFFARFAVKAGLVTHPLFICYPAIRALMPQQRSV